MRIGFIFQRDYFSGGSFTYEIAMALTFKKLQYDTIFFVYNESQKNSLARYGIDAVVLKKSLSDNIIRNLLRNPFSYWLPRKYMTVIEKQLKNYGVDIVYLPSPDVLAMDLIETNFIITVLDLCHLDFPEFPEVNFHREFEMREELYKSTLRKAVAIITDNEYTRKKISQIYGVSPERIHIIPYSHVSMVYLASMEKNIRYDDIRKKYSISRDYLYYPAQFWAHKNHVYIIDALKILHSRGLIIDAVFSGADKGNLNYVLSYAEKVGLKDYVRYLGFVSDEDKYLLYKNALALVMPTYFGPTNIPPLEAFALQVPVIYSDIEGLRDQVRDAALLCDLRNPQSLAECVEKLYNQDIRNKLIEGGKKIIQNSASDSKVLKILSDILESFQSKLKCWKS